MRKLFGNRRLWQTAGVPESAEHLGLRFDSLGKPKFQDFPKKVDQRLLFNLSLSVPFEKFLRNVRVVWFGGTDKNGVLARRHSF